MRWHAFIFLLLSHFLNAAEFDFPTTLIEADIPTIVRSFNSGFLARTPMSLLGQAKFATQISLRVNLIDTEKVSRLGSQSKDEEVYIQEFSFAKKLPLNVELGVHASLSMLDRDINSFGGFARWGFKMYSWGGFSVTGHGASGNYKNLLGTNLYGGSLNMDLNVWLIHVSAGTGFIRSTNTFDPTLFGNTGQPSISYSKMYSHQNVKLSYNWDRYAITAQGDWIKEFFSSVMLSYLF